MLVLPNQNEQPYAKHLWLAQYYCRDRHVLTKVLHDEQQASLLLGRRHRGPHPFQRRALQH